MAEKPPAFTVSDRRKFTLEGDVRDEGNSASVESVPAETRENANRVVAMPPPKVEEPSPAATPEESPEDLPQFTEQESAQQSAAYQQSSEQLDTLLRQQNPGMDAAGPVTFEHVVQSIYVSAMIALGAGTEPGQKPRVDILGARQSIDMLAVLQEKTAGNLSAKEQQLLQAVLFELRMMFLEITNAIAQSAHRQPGQPR